MNLRSNRSQNNNGMPAGLPCILMVPALVVLLFLLQPAVRALAAHVDAEKGTAFAATDQAGGISDRSTPEVTGNPVYPDAAAVDGTLPAAGELTLGRAKTIALENSPDLAAAKSRIEQALQAIKQARAGYAPTIAWVSSWDHTGAADSDTLNDDQDRYTNRISATQNLFQGFYRKYNTLSARYREKMSRAALEDAQRILAWSVAQSYFNAQLALEDIRIAQSDIAFNQEQEKEAIARERMKTGSYSDVLNFKTRVNTAKATLIQALQEYRVACFGLAALMGYEDARLPKEMRIPFLAVPDLSGNDDTGVSALPELEIAGILDTRPDLEQSRLAVLDADARLKRETSGFYPIVSLTGSYGAGSVEEMDSLTDTDHMATSISLEVRFELFDGGATRAAVNSAVAEKRELQHSLAADRITASKEIRSALATVLSAGRKLSLQQENTLLIEITRDLVRKEYEVGQASLVRLNEAQNDLVSAQGALAGAGISLLLALEALDYYTGRNI